MEYHLLTASNLPWDTFTAVFPLLTSYQNGRRNVQDGIAAVFMVSIQAATSPPTMVLYGSAIFVHRLKCRVSLPEHRPEQVHTAGGWSGDILKLPRIEPVAVLMHDLSLTTIQNRNSGEFCSSLALLEKTSANVRFFGKSFLGEQRSDAQTVHVLPKKIEGRFSHASSLAGTYPPWSALWCAF